MGSLDFGVIIRSLKSSQFDRIKIIIDRLIEMKIEMIK